MKSIPWDNPASNLIDDVEAMVKMVREDSGVSPDTIVCNLKTYAYLVLGHFVDGISASLYFAINYQLPPVKFTDHLSDCFGWAKCW